jgi:YHS domain-containing protein
MKLNTTLAIVGALVALGAIIIAGCNAAKPEADGTTGTAQNDKPMDNGHTDDMPMGTTVDYTNEKGELVCPVMGTVIESKDKAVGHQEYNGKTYYFCCGGCPDQFAEDPAKYAK